MGAKKKRKCSRKKMEVFCAFFCGHTTYGNEAISVGGHKKNTDLRTCSRLSKHCTKPAFEGEM